MIKPRGKTPSLISKSNGKPVSHKSERKTKCSRCESDILKDQMIFLIPKDGNGFTNQKPFCLNCFELVLKQTKEDLTILENELISFLSTN